MEERIYCKVICEFTSMHKRLHERKIDSIKKACADLGGIYSIPKTYHFRCDLFREGKIIPNNPKFRAIYSFPEKDIQIISDLLEGMNCELVLISASDYTN